MPLRKILGFEANVHKKIWGGIAFSAVIVGVVFYFAIYSMSWSISQISSSAGLTLDLAAPDALVRSKGLSSLPADLLKVPLLHDFLTEDFLFYYEHSEGRLGLKGAIRRIAYEHEVNIGDELIKLVMDEPADVALWRGSKGELKYYAIAMTRNNLAKMLEPLAKIAMKDRQLLMVGEVKIDGDTVQMFALEYALNRRLLLATNNDRVVVFSEPAMVLKDDGSLVETADDLLQNILGKDKNQQQRFARAFDLGDSSDDHSIAIKTNFLSFHYQHFFPALKALRFDFGEKSLLNSQSWRTAMLLDVDPARAAALMDGKALWQSLPYQAAACIALPVDWRMVANTMNSQQVVNLTAEQLSSLFSGPVGMCWYGKSRLHAPLFVTQLNKAEGSDVVLENYFNYGIKLGADAETQQKGQVKASITKSGDVLWQAPLNSDETRPTLARSGTLVYFSPDSALVEQALAVAHKRQPAVSDSWSDSGGAASTVGMIDPTQLAQLAELEVSKSLPRQQDELLLNAAEEHLLPKLAALKKYPPLRLKTHDVPKGAGWVELDWQPY
jgi:uncharacterized protein YfaA (DUF2138 family)